VAGFQFVLPILVRTQCQVSHLGLDLSIHHVKNNWTSRHELRREDSLAPCEVVLGSRGHVRNSQQKHGSPSHPNDKSTHASSLSLVRKAEPNPQHSPSKYPQVQPSTRQSSQFIITPTTVPATIILKATWPSGLRRHVKELSLIPTHPRGSGFRGPKGREFESHSCQFFFACPPSSPNIRDTPAHGHRRCLFG
jgi:hypothetical protein